MRIYIAGPMSGFADNNFPAFDRAKERLEAQGHEVVSPADLSRASGVSQDGTVVPEGMGYETFLKDDLAAVFSADGLYMLKGWEYSKGARLEHDLAVLLKKQIKYE